MAGFLLALTPLSNELLNWRGSGGLGAATVGTYYFFGGMLLLVGGLFEFILGNTFPAVVFSSFSAFWFTYGATLTPWFNAYGAYDPSDPAAGASNAEFAASFAFFDVYMGLLCLIYAVCALRTNIVFVGIFVVLVPTFGCFAGAFWQLALGNTSSFNTLLNAAGGLAFVVCLLGWYLFLVQILASVDFPINFPVGDLSHLIKGASERGRGTTEEA